MNNKFNLLIIVGIVIALFVFITVINSNKSNKQTAIESQPAQIDLTPAISPGLSNPVKIIKVEAGSYYYKPNEIRIKLGETIQIEMNSVSMMHNFNIDELNVHMPIVKNGDIGSVEFTADKVGTFEYYCSIGQHRQLGQFGKLIVEK